MAYKHAKGKVMRGDIYNEDDTQRNTYLDWSEDAVGFVCGGNPSCLVISGSGAVSSSLNISASAFYGDGSNLENVTSTPSPAGSDGQLQYNNGGSTGGASTLYWDDSNNRLGLGTNNPTRLIDVEDPNSAGIQLNATNHRAYSLLSDGYGFTIFDDTTGGVNGYRFVISDQANYLGYVGIGDGVGIAASAHPKALLHLSSSDDQALLRVDTTGGDSATTVLFATGSGRVGIGTADPDYTLDVAGNVGLDEYIYHNGDGDTWMRLVDNGMTFKAGGLSFINLDKKSSAPHELTINDGSNNIDFIVKGNGSNEGNPAFKVDASTNRVGINGVGSPTEELHVHGDVKVEGNDPRIKIDGDTDSHPGLELYENGTRKWIVYNNYVNDNLTFKTNSKIRMSITQNGPVGIGTQSPGSTFEVSGSQAGNYSAISTGGAAALTLDETHYIVNYTGNGDAIFTLPDVSGITGRQYHILHNCQGTNDVLTVTGSGGQFLGPHLEGPANSVNLTGNTPQSISIVSTGANWFILHDGRSEE